MDPVLKAIDRISRALGLAAMALFVVLTGAMLFEVVARRVFNSPTLWAYDIAYMSNGMLVVCAAGFALLRNDHIRIDFLATRFPRRWQDAINLVLVFALFLPALGVISWAAISEALRAFATGEIERVSTWGPVIWPYYGTIALGIVVLFLQSVATGLRHGLSLFGRGPSPLDVHDQEPV